MRAAFDRHRVRYSMNVHSLPGRPDFVFERAKLIVFTDGDFWHGYRFPHWRSRLSAQWQAKIERNRRRDLRNHRRLRRNGWLVVRLWGHQVLRDPNACADRVVTLLREKRVKPRSRTAARR